MTHVRVRWVGTINHDRGDEMAITHWDSKGARRDLRRAQAIRRRMILILGVTFALMVGGIVRVAEAADAKPGVVARFVQGKVNRQLRFAGSTGHVTRVVCLSNGGGFYSCKGRLVVGSQHAQVLWSPVKYGSDGAWRIPKPSVS